MTRLFARKNCFFSNKAFCLILLVGFLGLKGLKAQTTTYTFTSNAWAASTANWTSKSNGNAFTTGQGIQVTTSTSGACGNSPISFSNVTSVKVGYCTNGSTGAGNINVFSVASTTANAQTGTRIGSSTTVTTTGGTTIRYITFTASTPITGYIQIYTVCTSNSIYIASVDINNGPIITGAATATAYTTTYGTASSAQSFNISGSNLTANITATAPTGFEVSSDGSTYGSTAAFTQTNGSATGTLYVRLAATAAVSGSYNAQNIVLSSTGATNVNITSSASGNIVSPKALTISGLLAQNKNWDGTTTVSVTGPPAYSGLVNGESFSVSTSGTISFVFSSPNVGNAIALIQTNNYSAPSSNYTVTQPSLSANISAVTASSPTITAISPGNQQLSIAFTVPNSNGGASITNYRYSIDAGNTWTTCSPSTTSSPLLINGLTNGQLYNVIISAINSAGAGSASNSMSGTPAPQPTISASAILTAFTTTYGTASAAQNFAVSGAYLSADVIATAPSGYEVSSDGISYGATATFTQSSGNASGTLYIRLKTTAIVGTYNSLNIAFTSTGASTVNVSTTASGNAVSAKGLTITGLSVSNKTYDGTTSVSVTGTPSYSGLVNGESFAVGGSSTWAFATKTVGTSKSITQTGSYTAPSSNYTVTQPTLTADITAATLTISSPSVTSKTYDGSTTATITGTLSGVISPDVVTLVGTGTFATANAGLGIQVTASCSLSGADAGNYVLTQPAGLTGNILKTLAQWSFEGVTSTNTGSSINISGGTGVADAGDLISGTLFSATHSSSSTIWSNPAGNGSSKSINCSYWTIGDYYQFQINTSNYYALNCSIDQTGSNTGPKDFKIQYSLDGTTFSDLPNNSGVYYITNDSWSSTTFKGISTRIFDLTSLTTLNNKSSIYIRIVCNSNNAISGGSFASTGTNRIDNFVVNGNPCNVSSPNVTGASRCGNGTLTISASVGNGETVDWYSASTGGAALSSGSSSFTTPSLSTTTIYYAEARNTSTGCTSPSRTAVTATVNSIPSAPTATATQILCPGATVNNLSATGTAIQWYAASSGGSALSSGASLTNNTNYYATQTVNGCESATRTTVTTSLKNQWTGANSSSWSNNGNWSCGAVPSATDNILIATNSSNPTILDADFTVSASGTLTISGSGTLTINPGQKLTLTGNADFGSKLVTVATNASGTSGAIVLNGGALTGASNVSLQQYFTGQRAWRMLSNPFTTAITAAAISANNTSLSVNQSGTGDMVVYNSANDSWSANNSISANSCYGFFYKGLQSDFNGTPGLSNYSGSGPTATTFTVNGTLNTGAVSITPNASSVFTLVGNPFAAPVNSIALTGGSAAPYYYYQASSASTDIKVKSGAWIAAVSNSSSSTTIPMMGMIAYQAASNAPFSINTSDINTTNTSLSNLYKTTSSSNQMVLELHRNNSLFDRLILREDPFANVNKVDANDLVKKDNAIANVYAISPSNHHLALHTEPEFAQAIPIGITAPIGSYQFKFNATWNQGDWYLIDNYMHQQILLSATSPYNFDINSDLTSYGEKRFELLKKTWTTQVENTQLSETIRLQTNLVQQEIRFASTQATVNLHYQLKDMNGAVVKSGILQDLNQAINVEQLASGFYIVQLANARQQVSFKIVKQ